MTIHRRIDVVNSSPASRPRGLSGLPWALVHHRYLLLRLVQQQITAQYRQSVLGLGWAVLQPVLYTALFLVLHGLVEIPSDGLPYALFALTGMTAWGAFATSVAAGAASIVLNASLVRKIYFPRELFPAAAVVTRWLDFGIGLTLVAAVMVGYGRGTSWNVLWVPLLLLIQTVFAFALALVASAAGAFKRDVVLGIPFVLQLGIYVSPVIYPLSAVPEAYRPWFLLNPMTGVVESLRRVLLLGQPPEPLVLGSSAVVAFLCLATAYALFRRLEMRFADVV